MTRHSHTPPIHYSHAADCAWLSLGERQTWHWPNWRHTSCNYNTKIWLQTVSKSISIETRSHWWHAIDGITQVFESLLKAGVIVPCPDSPVRTPIFPVKKIRDKGQPDEWRFVQDLQAVNDAVQQRAPNVPNPYTIMSQVPSDSKWFSVVDLANAFFSVPVHRESQFWFAFSFKGKNYTFTRLCQGYYESPTLYNEALKDSLSSLILTPGSALLQYVDDLMVCAPTKEQLLQSLWLSEMSFLGMCSYCRSFIPNYSALEAPLSATAHGKGLTAQNSPPCSLISTSRSKQPFQSQLSNHFTTCNLVTG